MSMNDHPNDDSTEPDHDTTAGGYTVHHIDEDAAKRAVRRFQAKADRAETGERVAASGTVYIEDALLEEVDDGTRYLIDGEPSARGSPAASTG